MTFRLPHLAAALALHLVVLGLLLGGVQCSAKPIKPNVIQAVLLDPSRQDLAQRKREEQRRLAEDKKRREDETRRLAEQRRKAEAEAEALRQKQLADKKAAEKKAAEQKAADKKLADQKAAEQKKKAEAEAFRKKQEQERLTREAAARREAAEQARLEEALAREADELAANRAAQAVSDAARNAWAAALTARIHSRYTRPPNSPTTSCKVRMQLLPDGTVTSAKTISSCGSPFVDQAVVNAVMASSPMPRPADPSVFEPEVNINFEP